MDWKVELRRFKRELEKEYPIRGRQEVEEFMNYWVEREGWSDLRKDRILRSMNVYERGELLFRDEKGHLHIVRDVLDYNNWGLEEIYDYACEKVREFWGIEFDCEVKLVNRDWKRMLGCMRYYYDSDHAELVFSKQVNKRRKLEDLKDTIEHELVHWYLWSQGLPYGDDDPEFVREISRLGIGNSGTQLAVKAYEKYS